MSDSNENKKLQQTKFTIQEIWQAMRGNVQKNKKKYNRKTKHRNKEL
jgi:hypothetical protein